MDDCNWSKDRYDEIVKGMTPFLKATGYKEENIIWIPISGMTADNIMDPVKQSVCDWYKGPTFIEVMNDIKLV